MPSKTADYNVTALRKSISVLEILTQSDTALGVTEVSRRSGVSKNMAFRILETLADLGWVQQTAPGPAYTITLVPFRLFAGTQARANLLEQALPVLRDLHREVEETVYISVLHGDEALDIQVLQGSKPVSVSGKIGATYPLHCTAPGKVLLAGMDPAEQAQVLKRKLKKYTKATITDPDKLAVQLKKITRQGYAANLEEYGDGLLGLAAPILDADGQVLAAMGVFVPATNVPPAELENTFAGKVSAAAARVSALFGYKK